MVFILTLMVLLAAMAIIVTLAGDAVAPAKQVVPVEVEARRRRR